MPQTQFARNGDLHLAYQTIGSGALELFLVDAWVHHVEAVWDFPDIARFLRAGPSSVPAPRARRSCRWASKFARAFTQGSWISLEETSRAWPCTSVRGSAPWRARGGARIGHGEGSTHRLRHRVRGPWRSPAEGSFGDLEGVRRSGVTGWAEALRRFGALG